MLARLFQAIIDANVKLQVWLVENDEGECEIEEVLDILGVEEFDNITEV